METDKNVSQFDPTRPTVGAIYRKAQMEGDISGAQIGDLTNEMMKSLVDDLNEAIASNPFGGRPFYVGIYEKKDLQMPNAIVRRIFKTLYRPYPEDDSMVFWTDPRSNETRFCWCLPHWTEMYTVMNNELLYDERYVQEIKAWRAVDLTYFGFVKNEIGQWMPNPRWKDRKLVRN